MAKAVMAFMALGALVVAGDADGAQWKQVAKAPSGELWVDNASVKRNDGQAAFEYRIDFPKPQPVAESKAMYRSTVTKAMVRCAMRSISIGPATAYAGPRGTGKVVGTFPPTPEEARFQPVDPNSSDENLWKHVCKIAELTPKK